MKNGMTIAGHEIGAVAVPFSWPAQPLIQQESSSAAQPVGTRRKKWMRREGGSDFEFWVRFFRSASLLVNALMGLPETFRFHELFKIWTDGTGSRNRLLNRNECHTWGRWTKLSATTQRVSTADYHHQREKCGGSSNEKSHSMPGQMASVNQIPEGQVDRAEGKR